MFVVGCLLLDDVMSVYSKNGKHLGQQTDVGNMNDFIGAVQLGGVGAILLNQVMGNVVFHVTRTIFHLLQMNELFES